MSDLFSFGQNWVDQFKRKEKKTQIFRKEQGSLAYYFLYKKTIIFTLHAFRIIILALQQQTFQSDPLATRPVVPPG